MTQIAPWTYDSLVAALADWMEDDSDEFTANLPVIVGLGEIRCIRDLDLEIFESTVTKSLSIGSRDLTKEADHVRVRSLHITVAGKQVALLPRSWEYCIDYAPDASALAQPKYFAELDDTKFAVVPTPNQAYGYTLRYLGHRDALTSANQANWLAKNVPDLLFYACLAESAGFLKHPQAAAGWSVAYAEEKLPAALFELRGQGRADYKPRRRTVGVDK